MPNMKRVPKRKEKPAVLKEKRENDERLLSKANPEEDKEGAEAQEDQTKDERPLESDGQRTQKQVLQGKKKISLSESHDPRMAAETQDVPRKRSSRGRRDSSGRVGPAHRGSLQHKQGREMFEKRRSGTGGIN